MIKTIVAARRAAIPLSDGVYTIAEYLQPIVRRILELPRRQDVAERDARLSVFILRHHGGYRSMRQRPTFFLKMGSVARLLGMTKDMVETSLVRLTSSPDDPRLIERVAIPEDDHRREKWSDGCWRCKPIVYRLARQVADALAAIHDRAERRRAKSSTYTKFRISFFGSSGTLSSLVSLQRRTKNLSLHAEELQPLYTPPKRKAVPPSPIMTPAGMMPEKLTRDLRPRRWVPSRKIAHDSPMTLSADAMMLITVPCARQEPPRRSILDALADRAAVITATISIPRSERPIPASSAKLIDSVQDRTAKKEWLNKTLAWALATRRRD